MLIIVSTAKYENIFGISRPFGERNKERGIFGKVIAHRPFSNLSLTKAIFGIILYLDGNHNRK